MGKKLLMIDDDAGIAKVVELASRDYGIEFKAIGTPLTAVAEFTDFRPDIVILDLIMPGKDGIDVLNEILATGISTRIVLTSGYGDTYLRLARSVAKFHETAQVDVLRKPFRRNDLLDLLNSLSGA